MGDLHIHTIYSDGEYNEYEIIDKIIDAGIKEFAICDHDIIDGSRRVYEILNKGNYDLIFHSGVELSARVNGFLEGVNVHLLFRDFDYDDPNLKIVLEKIKKCKENKIPRMIDLVEKEYGIRISDKDIQEMLTKTESFGKPHMYMILSKYIDCDREEYYRKMDKLRTDKLDALEVLNLLKDSKGYLTLAHPIEIMEDYPVGYDFVEKIIGYLAKHGLKGLETRHSKHNENDYLNFSNIAKKYELIETSGSDFHGENVKPNVKLGVYKKR